MSCCTGISEVCSFAYSNVKTGRKVTGGKGSVLLEREMYIRAAVCVLLLNFNKDYDNLIYMYSVRTAQ
jgi:hypothetical protein